jgi:hypothetical protein
VSNLEAEQQSDEEVQYQEQSYDQQEPTIYQQEPQRFDDYPIARGPAVQQPQQSQMQYDDRKISNLIPIDQSEDRSGFIHGLSTGLGIGCIATFIIMWITVFFSPQLPTNVTYESMLSIFIYPLVYLLAVGLIALTAGVVREYYIRKESF